MSLGENQAGPGSAESQKTLAEGIQVARCATEAAVRIWSCHPRASMDMKEMIEITKLHYSKVEWPILKGLIGFYLNVG
jgi:hypothetical protein